jgi:hypothetical protein
VTTFWALGINSHRLTSGASQRHPPALRAPSLLLDPVRVVPTPPSWFHFASTPRHLMGPLCPSMFRTSDQESS